VHENLSNYEIQKSTLPMAIVIAPASGL